MFSTSIVFDRSVTLASQRVASSQTKPRHTVRFNSAQGVCSARHKELPDWRDEWVDETEDETEHEERKKAREHMNSLIRRYMGDATVDPKVPRRALSAGSRSRVAPPGGFIRWKL